LTSIVNFVKKPAPFNAAELPKQSNYKSIPDDFDLSTQNSIEQGYFVFTMMPSLRCSLNCPHCYLTTEQRRNSPIMSVDQLEKACLKVADYYNEKTEIKRKVIVFYWYGGEPTEMGMDYMLDAFKRIQGIFPEEDGYYIRHEVLTSLIKINDDWFDVFKTWGRGHFQTSFDGLMRGKGYVKLWDKRVRQARSLGLSVSTISVVNNKLMEDGPKAILDYLCDLGVDEISFLPFMLNENNEGDKYEKYAPPMSGYSDFMIEITEYWYEKKKAGLKVPYIGQMSYILSRVNSQASANIAGQTMFLLPEGDFVLPDYKNGYLEYMKPFGNIFEDDFKDILSSESRRSYLRKQYLRNGNSDCTSCESKNHCIMEFWKENRNGDDCFGAKKYVNWLIGKEKAENALSYDKPLML
jgi:sulfatase maturation enzyme AslB (radical SAM superfamily)